MTTKRNGSDPKTGWQLPKRAVLATLDGFYQGLQVTFWLNPPAFKWRGEGLDEAAMREAMAEVLLDWNYTDDKGKRMPLPSESEHGWDDLPGDLQVLIIDEYNRQLLEVSAVPKANGEQLKPI